MRVSPRHPQAAVTDFKLDDFLVHALVLHLAHSPMSERMHPPVRDSKLLAGRTKDVSLHIADFQRSAELRHEDSTGPARNARTSSSVRESR
jgi:hypothetical protein